MPERVRAAEVVGALSLATDLGMGLPFEHGLQATIFAAPRVDIPGVAHDDPATERGIVPGQPGLYFVGQLFLYSVSSAMIHGLARDARHVARHIASRRRAATDASPPMSTSSESGRERAIS